MIVLEGIRAIQRKADAIQAKYKDSNARLNLAANWLDSADDADVEPAIPPAPPSTPSDAHAALLAALGM